MSSVDKITEGFSHPVITPIVGQPAFDTLKELKLLLSTNAASVISHLGNGALGLLWLVVSDAVYNTLSAIPFFAPQNPGPLFDPIRVQRVLDGCVSVPGEST